MLLPEVDDVVLNISIILVVDYKAEGDGSVSMLDHLIGDDRLPYGSVVFLEETNEVIWKL